MDDLVIADLLRLNVFSGERESNKATTTINKTVKNGVQCN